MRLKTDVIAPCYPLLLSGALELAPTVFSSYSEAYFIPLLPEFFPGKLFFMEPVQVEVATAV